jgi:hypothetical protein
MSQAAKIRTGRGFPVDEAALLLRDGVYLPDYPIELVALAWQRNCDRYHAALVRLVAASAGRPDDPAWSEALYVARSVLRDDQAKEPKRG